MYKLVFFLTMASFLQYQKVHGIHINRNGVGDSNVNCKNLVCDVALEQAEGLSRLALLDEFVAQTVLLLNDLMKNIDTELEKTASSLLKQVNPYCESKTIDILEEVIEKQKLKIGKQLTEGATNVALGNGIDPYPMEPETWEGEFQGRENNGQETDSSEWPESGNSNSWGNGDFGTQKPADYTPDGRENPKNGHTGNHQNSGTIEVTDYDVSDKEINQNNKQQGNNWNNKHGNRKDDSNSNNHWSQKQGKPNTSQWTGQTNSKDLNGGQQKYETTTFSGNWRQGGNSGHQLNFPNQGCQGVGRKSVYWVPGLDAWCATNCATGYCPQTHCVC